MAYLHRLWTWKMALPYLESLAPSLILLAAHMKDVLWVSRQSNVIGMIYVGFITNMALAAWVMRNIFYTQVHVQQMIFVNVSFQSKMITYIYVFMPEWGWRHIDGNFTRCFSGEYCRNVWGWPAILLCSQYLRKNVFLIGGLLEHFWVVLESAVFYHSQEPDKITS